MSDRFQEVKSSVLWNNPSNSSDRGSFTFRDPTWGKSYETRIGDVSIRVIAGNREAFLSTELSELGKISQYGLYKKYK